MKTLKLTLTGLALLFIGALSAESGHHKAMQKGKHHKAKHFAHLDTNKNGKISKAEWLAMFAKIDKNKNGSISKAEMKAHHKMMKSHHMK